MILERGERADDVDRRFLAGTGGKALIVNSLAGEMLEEPFNSRCAVLEVRLDMNNMDIS